MSQIPHISPFDGIRHEDEHGKEYWSARELGKLLGYSSWHAFQNTLVKAREACGHNNQYALEHFYLQIDMVWTGNGSLRKTEAYRLSRYACYLIILNADPHKPIVAVGQAYFAYQARRQEVVDMISLSSRPDHLKQDVLGFLLYTHDCKLQKAAQETRIVEPGDFAIFFNHGYMGLLEWLYENRLSGRIVFTSNKQKMSDRMGYEELGVNIYRAPPAKKVSIFTYPLCRRE